MAPRSKTTTNADVSGSRPSGHPGATRGPTRRQLMAAAAALPTLPLLLSVPGCGGRPTGSGRRPNILFVLSDSHRAQTTGCYGDAHVATPSFDAFATQGARLTTAVANTPLCRPYRASLMTGTFGHKNGMLTNTSNRNFGVDDKGQWRPPHGAPTLGETFGAAGYECAYVGKWHLGWVNVPRGPLRFGFDDYWAAATYPSHTYWEWKYVTDEDEFVEGGGAFRPVMETDLVLDFLAERAARPSAEPWMMVLSWGPPHDPLEPPEEFRHYDDVPLPPNVRGTGSEEHARAKLPLYYASVEAIDQQFGRLVAALDTLGLADDTIVVYTSDHGAMLGSKGLEGKEMPFRESTGVPFLLRWPGRVPAGAVIEAPLGAPDIFPTLCGLAGLPVPAGLDGDDVSAVLQGTPGATAPAAAYLTTHEAPLVPWPGWRGVRTARHLYARQQNRPWLLFDLEHDPWQRRNLVDSAEAGDKALLAEMEQHLDRLMQRHGDRWGRS